MKHNILFFALIFLSLASVWAEEVFVCIDLSAPEAPGGLTVVGTTLQWSEAADSPDCSGIIHYEVYENGDLLGTTNLTSYVVTPNVGDVFRARAVDRAMNRGAYAEYTVPTPPAPPSGGGSSGGGSSGGGSTGGGGFVPPTPEPENETINETIEEPEPEEEQNETLPVEIVNETPEEPEPQPPAPAQLGFTPYTIMVGVLVLGLLALVFFAFK